MNNATDVELIQYYLSALICSGYLAEPLSAAKQSCAAVTTCGLDADDVSALKKFQAKMGIDDSDETGLGLVKPDGPTLRALVDYGDYAGQLNAANKGPQTDYVYHGVFNASRFEKDYKDKFNSDPRYTSSSLPQLLSLLQFLGADPYLIDIRWMAYILATVSWETTSPTAETDSKGHVKHPWRMTWAPVEESGHGKGRPYRQSVKIALQADGECLVTEWDGDQWLVKPSGVLSLVGKNAKLGVAPALRKPAEAYSAALGDEFTYFGRGYVQLTWWNNYASVGVKVGKGLSFLLNPDLVLDPPTAYQLMSHCLRTGEGFANRHKLGDYIYGGKADYVGARHMVNGTDHAADIAHAAKVFVGILMSARQ